MTTSFKSCTRFQRHLHNDHDVSRLILWRLYNLINDWDIHERFRVNWTLLSVNTAAGRNCSRSFSRSLQYRFQMKLNLLKAQAHTVCHRRTWRRVNRRTDMTPTWGFSFLLLINQEQRDRRRSKWDIAEKLDRNYVAVRYRSDGWTACWDIDDLCWSTIF